MSFFTKTPVSEKIVGVELNNYNTLENKMHADDNKNNKEQSSCAQDESFNASIKFTKLKNKHKKEKSFINLRIHQTLLKKLKSHEQIYFASIAPLKEDHIDVNCNIIKDIKLHYCCGLYLPIDSSFTVESLLSTEFMTSLQRLPVSSQSLLNSEHGSSYIPPNVISSKDDYYKSSSLDSKRHLVIYVPGQQYIYDELNAAESIMNECLQFYVNFPYVIVPFLWPSEGSLLSNDECVDAEKHCANELSTFTRRLWSQFEWIDIIGHGRGCNIVLSAMQMLLHEKCDVIKNSHIICIAPDMESKKFIKHVQTLRDNVKRITLYVNTWDWKLYSSKWWNWSSDRAGASILVEKGLDTIDTTDLLSEWFASNHYYLTNNDFQKDISQALSEFGGLDPKFRNYLLPMDCTSFFSFNSSKKNATYYMLTDTLIQKSQYNKNNMQNANQNINNNLHLNEKIDNNENSNDSKDCNHSVNKQ